MGNIQKKLTRRSEGGKRPERGAPRRGRTPGAGADKRDRPRAPAPAGGGRGAGEPAAGASPGPAAPPPGSAAPMGPAALKSQGNELFQNGQFSEAALKYSAAIAQLESAGEWAAPGGLPGPLRMTGAHCVRSLPANRGQGGCGRTSGRAACARGGARGQLPVTGLASGQRVHRQLLAAALAAGVGPRCRRRPQSSAEL